MFCFKKKDTHLELNDNEVRRLKKGESIEGILSYFGSEHYDKCLVSLNDRADAPYSIYFDRSGECAEKEILYVNLPRDLLRRASYYGNFVLKTDNVGDVHISLN